MKPKITRTERPRRAGPYILTRLLRRAGYDVPEEILIREGFAWPREPIVEPNIITNEGTES